MTAAVALIIANGGRGRAVPISQADSVGLLAWHQAREYMLQLINTDRASKGLKPVALDDSAGTAAQKHAEEMATQVYLSHYNGEGRLPDQRYTEAGGRDRVQENVFLAAGNKAKNAVPLSLIKEPLFRKRDLEDIQAAYFNQTPPYDLHRRNILDPHHTHVGIGLARAVGDYGQAVTNAQEFVAKCVDVEPIPLESIVGAALTVSGRMKDGFELHSVEIARDELPRPKDRSELENGRPYRTPDSFATYFPDYHQPDRRVAMQPDGRFRAVLNLSDNGKPGVYYVRVRVRAADGARFIGSQRTVIVRSADPNAVGTRTNDQRP